MSAKTTRVPEALADDVPDVIEALDIAQMLFDKGDIREAARFVRRASDAAHKASRLIALARAADELDQPVPEPAVSETRLSRPAVAPTASKPPPLPPRKTSAPPPVHTASATPPKSPTPAPIAASTPPPKAVSVAPKPASNPPPSRIAPTAATKPPPPKPASTPSMPAAKVPSSAPRLTSAAAKTIENRMRVCVRMSVRDGSLLVVRPLGDGEAPPAGTREAWLVMADADDGAVRGSAAR